jgi:hypothetical protein
MLTANMSEENRENLGWLIISSCLGMCCIFGGECGGGGSSYDDGSSYDGGTVNRRGISDENWNAMTPSEQNRYDQGMRELDNMTPEELRDLINSVDE